LAAPGSTAQGLHDATLAFDGCEELRAFLRHAVVMPAARLRATVTVNRLQLPDTRTTG